MMARQARSERRYWCPEGETHQDEFNGPSCAWVDHPHRLRIRRMLVCSECEQAYFNMEGFDEHECHSA